MPRFFHKEILFITFVLWAILSIVFFDVVFLNKTFKVSTVSAQALHTGAYGQEKNRLPFIPVNGTDTALLEEPILQFIKNSFRQGVIPLWNPHQALGIPLIGMLEVGIFFPLHFIMYLFPSIIAWDILILSRLFLSGLFVYLMMRYFRFHYIPSLVSAICFMLSGPMVLLQYWTANVDILLPLLIISLDRLIRRQDFKSMALTAIMVGLTFFAGHPEHIFLVNVYGVLFALFRLLSLKKHKESNKIFSRFLFAYILGLGLSSIVLFPFLQNLHSEFWHGHPEGIGLRNEEQPSRALSLALPHFFQNVPITLDWTFAGWWGGYLGTLPLLFAFLSLFKKQRNGLNYFFAGMAFFILAKVYTFPIINWIGYLPVFNVCRYAIHTPYLVAFSIAISAGMGVRYILGKGKVFTKGLVFSGILGLIVLSHFIFLKKNVDMSFAVPASVYAFLILFIIQTLFWVKEKKLVRRNFVGYLLVFLIFAELFSYINRFRPMKYDSFQKAPYIEALKSSPEPMRSFGILGSFYPNTASGYGVDDLGIFFALIPKRFVDFVNTFIDKDNFVNDTRPTALRGWFLDKGSEPFLDMLNVRSFIFPPQSFMKRLMPQYALMRGKMKPIYQGEVEIFVRANSFPRAFIVHEAVFEPNQERSAQALKEIKYKLREAVLIGGRKDEKILGQLAPLKTGEEEAAQIIQYSPNEVLIKAKLMRPGFLVLSDSFHPDWRVYINGQMGKVYLANNLVRAVFLEAGEHEVKFVFHPNSFYFGSIASLISLLVIMWMLVHRPHSWSATPGVR